MADIYWKKDDTLPADERTLTDADGPIDLTGATVLFKMWVPGAAVAKVSAAAAIIGLPTDGRVRYTPVAADTDTAGNFIAEYEADFGGGSVLSVPNDRSLEVLITDSL